MAKKLKIFAKISLCLFFRSVLCCITRLLGSAQFGMFQVHFDDFEIFPGFDPYVQTLHGRYMIFTGI